jgi:hypothetical protein
MGPRPAPRSALILLTLASAGACQSDAVRYFRVAYAAVTLPGDPQQRGQPLPEACFQPADLPGAISSAQVAAEAFCGVGKAPMAGGTASQNEVVEESWTLVDQGGDQLILARRALPTATSETAALGRRQGATFLFSSEHSDWAEQCASSSGANDAGFSGAPQLQISVCDGRCVNLSADPGHCGACDNACPPGQACDFGRCSSFCNGVFMQQCGGQVVDVNSDPQNCGICANACPDGTICGPSLFGGQALCQRPCEAFCSKTSLSDACGEPAMLTRTIDTVIALTVQGDSLTGTLTQALAFACVDGGCAVDFDSRCPSCSVGVNVSGTRSATDPGSPMP